MGECHALRLLCRASAPLAVPNNRQAKRLPYNWQARRAGASAAHHYAFNWPHVGSAVLIQAEANESRTILCRTETAPCLQGGRRLRHRGLANHSGRDLDLPGSPDPNLGHKTGGGAGAARFSHRPRSRLGVRADAARDQTFDRFGTPGVAHRRYCHHYPAGNRCRNCGSGGGLGGRFLSGKAEI